MDFRKRKIAVIGAGAAGASAARYLAGCGAGVCCFDDRPLESWDQGFLSWCRKNNVETCCPGCGRENILDDTELVVVSPGVPPYHTVVQEAGKRRVPVVGELFLAASLWKGPLVGITGTNGKTTTTLLTSHLLKNAGIDAVYGGNISPPLFDLFAKNSRNTCAVLEISSFQLEYFPEGLPPYLKAPKFSSAVCLNVAPDHLDRHATMDAYKEAKERLFQFQDENGLAVLGEGAESFKVKARPVLLKDIVFNESAKRLEIPIGNHTETFDISSWNHLETHNLKNLAASFASGLALGVPVSALEKGLGTFSMPAHRLECFCSWQGLRFIDDSKATNVHAVVTGLKAVPGSVILIAGGRAKGEDFGQLANALCGMENGNGPKVKGLVLIGESAKELSGCLQGYFSKIVIIRGDSGQDVMNRAVSEAVSMAREGDSIVLSPACASFDLFSNYKERGEVFKQAVARCTKGAK